jgi:hypothetical protein
MQFYIENISKTYNILFKRNYTYKKKAIPYDANTFYSATGYKIAYLADLGNFPFRGLVHGSYCIKDKAICNKNSCDFLSCNCGFYAFSDKKRAVLELNKHYGALMLEVELYSEIIIHEFGYRSKEQDVMRVFLPNKCSKFLCTNNTSGVFLKYNRYQTICSEHKNGYISIRDLSNKLGLEVLVI